MGSTNIEALTTEFAAQGLDTEIHSFTTTHSLKAALLGNLASALQDGVLSLLNEPAQRHEFEAFQANQTSTGAWSYSAPAGSHDDTVIATMAAWNGVIGSLHRGTIVFDSAPGVLVDYRG